MATITEDYVSLEIAKLLKEKGFDEKCFALYNPDGMLIQSGIRLNNIQVGRVKGSYSAPTLQMAMKWLREVHKLSVRPRYDEVEDEKEHLYYKWFFDILSMNPYKTLVEPTQGYFTYEEACEAAIKYCLGHLIK